MAKRTAKEMGIPSGFRISEVTSKNIVRVAGRMKFSNQVMKLAWDEVELMVCISDQLYTRKDLVAYENAVAKVSGKVQNIVGPTNSIRLSFSGTTYDLGGTYSYGNVQSGIVCMDIFKNIVNSSPLEYSGLVKEYSDTERSYTWCSGFCVVIEPRADQFSTDSSIAWSRLSPVLQGKIKKHMKACKKLSTKVYDLEVIVRRILAKYSSAISLCNDAPEFIKYIQEASQLNPAGHRCTDMEGADLLQELSKL